MLALVPAPAPCALLRRMLPRLALRLVGPVLLVCLLLVPAGAARAQAVCPEPVARLVSAQGPVEVERGPAVRRAALDDVLCRGDVIRVGPRGRAALALADGGVLRLDQNTTCRVGEAPGRSLLDLLLGAVHFLSRATRALEVSTPFVNAAVEGTEFVLRVLPDRALLGVYEGRVVFANPLGRLVVAGGQEAEAVEGRAPVLRIAVRPRDAVQWALYYPPVLTPLAAPAQGAGLPPALAETVAAVGRGDLAAAFARLEAAPAAERDAAYHTLRAGLLLSVGRAEEARAAIDRARALAPAAAEPLALGAVIAVAQDDRPRALAEARRAAELDPDSTAAALALSYSLQAAFELEAAREALRAAVERHPGDPLLRARLAELALALGEVGAAHEEAEAAVALGPELAQAHAVLGFVELARLDTDAAEEAFRRAIGLEPDAPLPHLGLGLALIRANELGEGRREIEVAAALAPNDALVRSYLGKAYAEEGLDEAAAETLATAQALDPLDPTPFFYDAIREQPANRPVEALRDLERAIDLNDNRAVYRSRLLLDQDLAARTASLARIYEDLGFDQLAVTEAATSLAVAPTSASAHRFLADAYAELPRHEIARTSELLQAQLLAPLNADPVQPRLAVDDLNVVAGLGPEAVGFNEFTPLFERERPRLLLSGLVGDDDTWGEEVVLSGLYGRFAYSLGQFHSETDGFRENASIENDLYDAFGQVRLAPWLSVQAEYRRRETEEGDIILNFDPDDFGENDRGEIRQDTARLGARLSPSPGSDLLLSVIYSEREEEDLFFQPEARIDVESEEEGIQAEARYLFEAERFNATVGGGTAEIDVDRRDVLDFAPLPCLLPGGVCEFPSAFTTEQDNVYAYANLNLPESVIWTLGIGYDAFERRDLDLDEFNPKLGLQWMFAEDARLRLAAVRTLKRTLTVNQTIEPTQVAGFNQFFDDLGGTVAQLYGVGLDARLRDGLYAGVEVMRRDLEWPVIDPAGALLRIEDRREHLYRGYVYWTPGLDWAVSAEVRYEAFERRQGRSLQVPLEVDTFSLPLAVRYFHPSGVFAGLGATYVYQDVNRVEDPRQFLAEGHDDFVVLDATLGYRLPRRRGVVSVEARNLLDQEFFFQDDNFRSTENRLARFVPDAAVLLRATLSF